MPWPRPNDTCARHPASTADTRNRRRLQQGQSLAAIRRGWQCGPKVAGATWQAWDEDRCILYRILAQPYRLPVVRAQCQLAAGGRTRPAVDVRGLLSRLPWLLSDSQGSTLVPQKHQHVRLPGLVVHQSELHGCTSPVGRAPRETITITITTGSAPSKLLSLRLRRPKRTTITSRASSAHHGPPSPYTCLYQPRHHGHCPLRKSK